MKASVGVCQLEEAAVKTKHIRLSRPARAAIAVLALLTASQSLLAQSVDFPNKKWGISFGNSKEFTGLRFNFRDSQVVRLRGVNITLWQPRKDNKDALVEGVSLGVIPGGGVMRGVQVGLLGAGAEKSLAGLSIGFLGVGAGEDVKGISIGGLGAGAGNNMTGVNIGGLGVGAGENLTGLNIGGFGVGAGERLTGINIGGFAVGGGGDVKGLNIGGLAVGAGDSLSGISLGGLAVGAGEKLTGLAVGGLAVGAGEKLVGIAVGGLAVGSPEFNGLGISCLVVGGKDLKGAFISGAVCHVVKDGRLNGLAVSPFNYIKGRQTGLTIGIVNYAWKLEKGIQLGLVNIIRDNPPGLKVLPVFNTSFVKE